MLSSEIKITRIERAFHAGERSNIIAIFDAQLGDFRIKRGTLRIHADGLMSVGLGGRAQSGAGVTLPFGCETREALTSAVIKAHKEMRSEIRKAGQWYRDKASNSRR